MNLDSPIFIGIFSASATAFITALVSNVFQNKRESKTWLKNQLQNLYSDSIRGLSALITLSADHEENLDSIEKSLVEAKKGLALSIVFMDTDMLNQKIFKDLKNEILVFISGDYKKLMEIYTNQKLKPSARFENTKLKNYEMYATAEIILKRVIEAASLDTRLH
jgi:hypothetical protein